MPLNPAPPAAAPTLPAFVTSALVRMSPTHAAVIGGVVFLGLIAFDHAKRVKALEQELRVLRARVEG